MLGNIGALCGEETRAKRIREDDNQPPRSCFWYSCLLVLVSAPPGKSPGHRSCSLRAPFPCHMAPAAHPISSTSDWPSRGCQQRPSRDWYRSRPMRPDSTGQIPHRAPHLFQPDGQFGGSRRARKPPPVGVPAKADGDVARAPPRGPTRWSPRAIPCPFRFRQLMAATTALAREEHSSSFLATHAAASHHRGPRPPPVQGLRGGAAAVRRQLKLGPAREGMRQPRAVPGLVPRSCTPRKALSHHPPQETGSRPASTGSVTDWTNLAIIEYVRDK